MFSWIKNILDVFFALTSSIIIEFIVWIFFWLPSLGRQLQNRNCFCFYRQIRKLNALNTTNKPIVFFHCSSAGEFEQARSVYEKFNKHRKEFFYVFLMHSVSGMKYIEAKNIQLNVMLTPIDTLWRWTFIFLSLKPTMIIYTRYEMWPSQLLSASFFGVRQCLIIASSQDLRSSFSRYYFKWCTKFLHSCSLVNQIDLEFFRNNSFASMNLHVDGDPKYDNVMERSINFKKGEFYTEKILPELENSISVSKFNFICGSIWESDLVWLLNSLEKIPDVVKRKWKVIFIPHDISESSIRTYQFVMAKYSLGELEVQLIPKLGILFGFYEKADACFVGGSVSGKVHNVLESLVFKKRTIIGASYSNSLEAINAIESGLIKIVEEKKDLSVFLEECMAKGRVDKDYEENVDRFFSQKSGSAERIFNFLNSSL